MNAKLSIAGAALVAILLGLGSAAAAVASSPPIVIGQSLPLTGVSFSVASRILAGAKAYVAAVNSSGGIRGRPLELVTLDDANDPKRYAENAKQLVLDHKAIALVNCLGDQLCRAAADAAAKYEIPLVGPISGSNAIRGTNNRYVFSIRPSYAREADALVRQLRAVGISRVSVLSEDAPVDERPAALLFSLHHQGIKADFSQLKGVTAQALSIAAREIAQHSSQALIIDLDHEAVDSLSMLAAKELDGLPPMMASLASPAFSTLSKLFRDKVIGFTSVVPNPEILDSALVRNLIRDAEKVGVEAITFEGLESYLSVQLCVEGIRRSGASNGKSMVVAIENLGDFDMGGFRLSFTKDRRSASDWIGIGLRSRSGHFLR